MYIFQYIAGYVSVIPRNSQEQLIRKNQEKWPGIGTTVSQEIPVILGHPKQDNTGNTRTCGDQEIPEITGTMQELLCGYWATKNSSLS